MCESTKKNRTPPPPPKQNEYLCDRGGPPRFLFPPKMTFHLSFFFWKFLGLSHAFRPSFLICDVLCHKEGSFGRF